VRHEVNATYNANVVLAPQNPILKYASPSEDNTRMFDATPPQNATIFAWARTRVFAFETEGSHLLVMNEMHVFSSSAEDLVYKMQPTYTKCIICSSHKLNSQHALRSD
jgi:hypothetical protein